MSSEWISRIQCSPTLSRILAQVTGRKSVLDTFSWFLPYVTTWRLRQLHLATMSVKKISKHQTAIIWSRRVRYAERGMNTFNNLHIFSCQSKLCILHFLGWRWCCFLNLELPELCGFDSQLIMNVADSNNQRKNENNNNNNQNNNNNVNERVEVLLNEYENIVTATEISSGRSLFTNNDFLVVTKW